MSIVQDALIQRSTEVEPSTISPWRPSSRFAAAVRRRHLGLGTLVAVTCFLSLLPLATVVVVSLTSGGFTRFPPTDWGTRWYGEALSDPRYRNAFTFSVMVATAVALVSGVLGTMAAFAIANFRFRGRGLLVGIITAPLAIGHVVIAIALLVPVVSLGFTSSPTGLLIGHVIVTTPFIVRMMTVAFAQIPESHLWASDSLGASQRFRFLHVVMPAVAPAAMASTVFVWLLSFDEVSIGLFLSLPDRTPLQVELFNHITTNPSPLPSAVNGILIGLSLIVILVLNRTVGILRLLLGEPPTTKTSPPPE